MLAEYSYSGSAEDSDKQVFILQDILSTITSRIHHSYEFQVFANDIFLTLTLLPILLFVILSPHRLFLILGVGEC
jgi:hypothetical protein